LQLAAIFYQIILKRLLLILYSFVELKKQEITRLNTTMDYYIGIDIGTTSTKAVAFSVSGVILAQASQGYPILHPQENQSEQHPEKMLDAVVDCLTQIATALREHNPVLVSFSSALHGLILMDKNGRPLTDCIIWADNRAGELADSLRETVAGRNFYGLTGVPIHAMSPLCKICWLKENQPALFIEAAKFIGIKEFICHRLFQKYIVDTAIASATGLLNIHSLLWEESALHYAGIDKKQLSAVVPTTHIEYLTAALPKDLTTRLHAFMQTAFVIGSSDGALANLGSGATVEGSMAVTIGTSSAVRIVTHTPFADKNMRTFCYHLSGKQYIVGGGSNSGAIVLQWLKEKILTDTASYTDYFSMAEAIAPGSNELLLLPFILGERAPIWNSTARGVFWGLDIKHTNAHLVRAAMEAVVYNTYSIGKVLLEKNKVDTIYANGGFTDSAFWIQMLADMFNIKVVASAVEESSAFGAVIIGMEALKIPGGFNFANVNTYQPDAANHQIYLRQCTKMERLYEVLKNEF
jgi:gluconokinase